MGFIIRECIWDVPILSFAYVLFRGPKIYVELEVAVETFEVSFAGLGLPCVGLHVHNLRMMGSFFIYLHTQTQTYIYM